MKKINIAALTGFGLCFTAIIFGIITNGGIGTIIHFLHFPSLLVTLGGALFAVLMTADSFADFLDGLFSFEKAFQRVPYTAEMLSEEILTLSEQARKEGLLVLEENSGEIKDEFLTKGIRLIVDGTDSELVRDILDNELTHKLLQPFMAL